MVDYYPLLAKAIAKSPEGGAQARDAIFESARAALTRQLRNIEPAISETVIAQEQASLEDAIRRVQAEFSYTLDLDDGLVSFDRPWRTEQLLLPAPDLHESSSP
ncbi:hypothetical protein [Bradyrhizobium prioriisuperbiae]|uniref:hypothetical protein n=1 Tax=Bradyrhizobium prioriisuperbiae TaxID=2854389 RepID=UPI0028F04E24|nr:hypothetical protein [Bradyrhizobium prioritasuperba]